MAQPDSISGTLPDIRAQAPAFLARAERTLILQRIRLGTILTWGSGFLVGGILFLLAAPSEFHLTFRGLLLAFALLASVLGASLLHLRHLGGILGEHVLGPDVYRPLTRFPQVSSILFFILATAVSAVTYLWVKLYLDQSLWVSFITMAMFWLIGALCSVSQYFVVKQNLMKVFKLLAGQPGFHDSFARFTTSLRAKFGFGMLGITGGVLVLSIMVAGLTLQSSIRTKVSSYAGNELVNLADSVIFVSEMNTTPEDLDAFLGTLKLGAGGGVSLQLPPAKGGRLLGSKIQPKGAGDILVVQHLPDGSDLRAVIPESEYADAIWKALRPNLVILFMAGAFLAFILPLIDLLGGPETIS